MVPGEPAGRPNGARGWIRADAVDVRPVANRIVVRPAPARSRSGGCATASCSSQERWRSGAAGAETPLGRDFYVPSAFVPTDPFFGSFALETSAYSRVTDWPTDVVGIHGTNLPRLLGQAVSHGCVRVANDVARAAPAARAARHADRHSPVERRSARDVRGGRAEDAEQCPAVQAAAGPRPRKPGEEEEPRSSRREGSAHDAPPVGRHGRVHTRAAHAHADPREWPPRPFRAVSRTTDDRPFCRTLGATVSVVAAVPTTGGASGRRPGRSRLRRCCGSSTPAPPSRPGRCRRRRLPASPR